MYIHTLYFLLYIYLCLYCGFVFGKKIGKIANNSNTLVVGQMACWLVFIFSNFVMPKNWKNGKIGIYTY